MSNYCPFCNAPTDEEKCPKCGQLARTLTLNEMLSQLCKRFPMEPPFEVSTDEASRVKVFITHHTGEAEASEELVQQHIRITGKLPLPGNKLLALPKGMSHKAFAIPIAEVIRVEPVH